MLTITTWLFYFKGGLMSQNGYSSNHGMTVSDAKNELLKQEAALIKQNKGHVVACPYCSEQYHFSKKEYDLGDAVRLADYLSVKRCPWCEIREIKNKDVVVKTIYGWKSMLELCSINGRMHPVTEHNFCLPNGVEIKTIRKPEGWKGVRKIVKEEKK